MKRPICEELHGSRSYQDSIQYPVSCRRTCGRQAPEDMSNRTCRSMRRKRRWSRNGLLHIPSIRISTLRITVAAGRFFADLENRRVNDPLSRSICRFPPYFPVSTPPASGYQAATPLPSDFAAGVSSRSTVRSIKEYATCRATKGVQPRKSATVYAGANHRAGASDRTHDFVDRVSWSQMRSR
jgi:hypothetical protein